jgi:hypothetical protein
MARFAKPAVRPHESAKLKALKYAARCKKCGLLLPCVCLPAAAAELINSRRAVDIL